MKTVYPNYYKSFRCIADKCKNSCCINWEIDIDEDSLVRYENIGGAMGEKLKSAISYDESPHFKLTDEERCPFLNEKGLCDLIIELGEDSICEICREHPRFRNYFFDAMEIGLGLCCEAAADLIINSREPFELVNFDIDDDVYDEDERELLKLRTALIDVMKDRALGIKERHECLSSFIKYPLPEMTDEELIRFFLSLERLDERWTDVLESIANVGSIDIYGDLSKADEEKIEQITIYFLYRYIAAAESVQAAEAYVFFALISTKMIIAASRASGIDICESARMYSSEIEYSDENVIKICELL